MANELAPAATVVSGEEPRRDAQLTREQEVGMNSVPRQIERGPLSVGRSSVVVVGCVVRPAGAPRDSARLVRDGDELAVR